MARISATFGLFYVLKQNFEMRHYFNYVKVNVYSYFNILRFLYFLKIIKFVSEVQYARNFRNRGGNVQKQIFCQHFEPTVMFYLVKN